MRQRIVFGINGLTVGGAERQLIRLLRELDTIEYELHLVTLAQYPDQQQLYDDVPPYVKIHTCHFRNFFDGHGWWSIYHLLQKIKPDVVVSSFFLSNTVFRVLSIIQGYAVIPREHNTYTSKPKLHQLVDRLLAFRCHTIVAVSEGVAEFTSRQEHIPRTQFTVIQNGIDVEGARSNLETLPSRSTLRRTLKIDTNALVILSVARLVAQKRHALMIDAFANFVAKHPEALLCIIGEGNLHDTLRQQVISLNLVERVRFYGFQDVVWPFYKVSDIFISTSQIEGFSNAYLEATVAGLPLVVTQTAGTTELVVEGKTGYLINDTVQDIVVGLDCARKLDPVLVAQTSSEHIYNFSIQHTARAYERLFAECQ